MVSASHSESVERASHLLSALAVLSAGAAGAILLSAGPRADVFFTGWVLVAVGLALVGGISAWTNRTPLVWVAALALTGLSVVGMWSIGLFLVPAALLLLGSAALSHRVGPREEVRTAILADPPSPSKSAAKAASGAGSVAVGAWLVYASAVEGGLFEACATETLACTLENTHWDAVGTTVVGLLAVSLGGWLLWKQVYAAHLLVSGTSNW
ncbi:hypothetical protein [Halorussus sp. MSC15.2]|uniref:hypothetical protein n=1 Tax=Halorussus sp. MSC15.2 TaxID=2283638 RepID=UPI0013D72A77|nr:hypothetical protein [Halorussus sp. MSC15.2]NEU57869.1 hypothetical protein [Halorussus sp. MSC15.2]